MKQFADRSYLLARARQERAVASVTEDNCAALVHFRMADEYERRARLLSGERGPAPAMPAQSG